MEIKAVSCPHGEKNGSNKGNSFTNASTIWMHSGCIHFLLVSQHVNFEFKVT